MVNLRRLTDRAKDAVEKRGGTDALKEDMHELRNIAKGKGSLKEKAQAAKDAIKDPGREGAERRAGETTAGEKPKAPPTPATPPSSADRNPPEATPADTPDSPRTK